MEGSFGAGGSNLIFVSGSERLSVDFHGLSPLTDRILSSRCRNHRVINEGGTAQMRPLQIVKSAKGAFGVPDGHTHERQNIYIFHKEKENRYEQRTCKDL